jgi:hypothetical protein
MPIEGQLFVVRFYRDDARLTEIRAAVIGFLSEIESTLAELREKINI